MSQKKRKLFLHKNKLLDVLIPLRERKKNFFQPVSSQSIPWPPWRTHLPPPDWPTLVLSAEHGREQTPRCWYRTVTGSCRQSLWKPSAWISKIFSSKWSLRAVALTIPRRSLRRTWFGTLQNHVSTSFASQPSPWQARTLEFSSGLAMTKRLRWNRFGSMGLEWIPGWKPRAMTWVVRFPKYKRKYHGKGREENGVCVCVWCQRCVWVGKEPEINRPEATPRLSHWRPLFLVLDGSCSALRIHCPPFSDVILEGWPLWISSMGLHAFWLPVRLLI